MVVENEAVTLTTSGIKVYCQTDECSLSLVTESGGIGVEEYSFNDVEGLTYAFAYNNATDTVSLTYNLAGGAMNFIRMKVSQGDTEICDVSDTSAAGVLNCDVSGYTGHILVSGTISQSPERVFEQLSYDLSRLYETFGNSGLWWTILILFVLATIGLATRSMVMTLVLVATGLGITTIMGLYAMGITTVVSFIALIGLIIIKLRSN